MDHYIGLDVYLETTFISAIDEKGKIINEGIVKTEAEDITGFLKEQNFTYAKIGIESGQLSISLCKSLSAKGLPVICVDARHMSKLLAANINKNDKNDARGIAQAMRAGLYKEIQIKSDDCCKIKMLLGSRRQLVDTRQQINGTIRGLLKIHGVKISSRTGVRSFAERVGDSLKDLDKASKISIEALLSSIKQIEKSIEKLDKELIRISKETEDIKLLTTIPGVGIITDLTYISSIDSPGRFENSENVGAYLGLTPRQYASGEIDRHGGTSKMGPKYCRNMLYEAAQSILMICKKFSKLKACGLKIMKKKGVKKAVVAVARKLAVIIHRMLVDRTAFSYS